MKSFHLKFFAMGAAVAAILVAGLWARPAAPDRAATAAVAAAPAASPLPADDKPDPALVAKGKERYQAYRCFDCHGKNGEGTDDAPDLIGTHLDADGIAKFLAKPSADAQSKGMPTIPLDSPDSKPLVAFVLSIKKAN